MSSTSIMMSDLPTLFYLTAFSLFIYYICKLTN